MGQRLGRYALFILIFLLTASISACSKNSEPKLQWYRTFGEGTDVYGGSVQQTTDGGYVIFGRMFSWKTSPEGGAFIIKTDTTGNKLWDKVFGVEEGAFGQSGQQTAAIYCAGKLCLERPGLLKPMPMAINFGKKSLNKEGQ